MPKSRNAPAATLKYTTMIVDAKFFKGALVHWIEDEGMNKMRQLNYEENAELAKTDLESAIREAKINWTNARNRPEEGTWAGLYLELAERRKVV